jgi:hypothetical protein
VTDSLLIDEIVKGVLQQLAGGGTSADQTHVPEASAGSGVTAVELPGKLITAESLAALAQSATAIIAEKAIVTPAAWDVVRERRLQLIRGRSGLQAGDQTSGKKKHAGSSLPGLLIVVQHTAAVSRLCEESRGDWRRELLGCPDDAAKLAIAEITRGGSGWVVILAQQTLRAACLANRNDRVKAVPVQSPLDIKTARQQLRVNTWCIDPSGKSWFELRNLLKAIRHEESK